MVRCLGTEGAEELVNELKAKEARIRKVRQQLEETLRKKRFLDWSRLSKSS